MIESEIEKEKRIKQRRKETAERLIYLLECSKRDIPKYEKKIKETNEDRKWTLSLLESSKNNVISFERQLQEMSKEYGLIIDLEKDEARYKD